MADSVLSLEVQSVHLEQLEAFFWWYDDGQIQEDLSQEFIQSSLNSLKPLTDLGQEYENMYVPAVPASNLRFTGEFLLHQNCYIKQQGEANAIKSGKRSAIMLQDGKYYRYKGCGNLNEYFPVEQMAFPIEGREIRGCCFEQTALREQYMTNKIDDILSKFNMQAGNKPIGIIKYNYQDYSKIDKFCGVFQTFGEKRLGSHLLSGVDIIAASLTQGIEISNLLGLFNIQRVQESGVKTTYEAISFRAPLDTDNIHEWTQQGVYHDNSLFTNLVQQIDQIQIKQDFVNIGEYNLQTRNTLISLSQLLYEIGYQCGQIKRIFQNNEISWGYFIDHNPFEPHCNAHPNNFVILLNNQQVVAPIDFDMAYTFESFINTVEEDKLGTKDFTLFQSWVNSERTALETALAGMENMANFTYSSTSDNLLQILFRDQIVLGYRDGFEMKERTQQIDILESEYQNLIQIALFSTKDVTNY